MDATQEQHEDTRFVFICYRRVYKADTAASSCHKYWKLLVEKRPAAAGGMTKENGGKQRGRKKCEGMNETTYCFSARSPSFSPSLLGQSRWQNWWRTTRKCSILIGSFPSHCDLLNSSIAQLTPPTFLLLFWLSPPPSLPSAVSAWCRGWGKRINTHTHTHIYRAMWVDAFTYTRARHRNSVASGFHKHLPRSGDLLSFIHWSFQDRFLVACLAFSVCLFSICFLFCNELELHHLTPSVCSANLIDWSLWF